MADEMIDWLRRQIAEDERAANRAADLCGCHPSAPTWVFDDDSTGGRIAVVDDPHPETRKKPLDRRWNGSYTALFMAQHIVNHDPARVLREVQAKRRILEIHSLARSHRDDGQPVCGACRKDRVYPCLVVRLLAEVYRDRPGWHDEWAVQGG